MGGALYVGRERRRSHTIGRVVAALGLVLFLGGPGCLVYMTVRAMLGDGFEFRPWLPLGGGLVLVGAVSNRVGRSMAVSEKSGWW